MKLIEITTPNTGLYLLYAEMIAIMLSVCESHIDYCISSNGFASKLK